MAKESSRQTGVSRPPWLANRKRFGQPRSHVASYWQHVGCVCPARPGWPKDRGTPPGAPAPLPSSLLRRRRERIHKRDVPESLLPASPHRPHHVGVLQVRVGFQLQVRSDQGGILDLLQLLAEDLQTFVVPFLQ